ncbi:hypothetical protein MYX06_04685 [Patescibacteria group bacterium AH-259-L05]|nr:hypothetical protein [Patescibacteria group bacterium AH-259-L05]
MVLEAKNQKGGPAVKKIVDILSWTYLVYKEKVKKIVYRLSRAYQFYKKNPRSFKKCLRCLRGLHNLPSHWAFEFYGAVFVGGTCPVCGRLKQKKFLGNVWTEEEEREGIVVLKGYDISFAQRQGYEVRPL